MFEAIGVEPPEIAVARSMEVSSFRMADRVVVPSPGIGALATDRYELEADRVVVGTPPIAGPRHYRPHPGAGSDPRVRGTTGRGEGHPRSRGRCGAGVARHPEPAARPDRRGWMERHRTQTDVRMADERTHPAGRRGPNRDHRPARRRRARRADRRGMGDRHPEPVRELQPRRPRGPLRRAARHHPEPRWRSTVCSTKPQARSSTTAPARD